MPLSPRRGRLLQILGACLAAGSIGGQWWSAVHAERAIRDQNDAALARYAAAYLAVVTPSSPTTGLDARRLVSAANTIADASFWPGGFQMAVGSVALVADTIHLLPLPDSVIQLLELGAPSVVTTHTRYRVTLVPLDSAVRQGASGWAAAWNSLPPNLPSGLSLACTAFAVGAMGCALVIGLQNGRILPRLLTAGAALSMLLLMAVALGISVRRTAATSTAMRLLTARRLIEIAATASGVKQGRLASIAAGLKVEELGSAVAPVEGVDYRRGSDGMVARAVAMTPRSDGALELRLVPVEAGLGRMWAALLLWIGLGSAALVGTAGAAGLSAPERLFHSAGTAGSLTHDEESAG